MGLRIWSDNGTALRPLIRLVHTTTRAQDKWSIVQDLAACCNSMLQEVPSEIARRVIRLGKRATFAIEELGRLTRQENVSNQHWKRQALKVLRHLQRMLDTLARHEEREQEEAVASLAEDAIGDVVNGLSGMPLAVPSKVFALLAGDSVAWGDEEPDGSDEE